MADSLRQPMPTKRLVFDMKVSDVLVALDWTDECHGIKVRWPGHEVVLLSDDGMMSNPFGERLRGHVAIAGYHGGWLVLLADDMAVEDDSKETV